MQEHHDAAKPRYHGMIPVEMWAIAGVHTDIMHTLMVTALDRNSSPV
jgi:hypothetical protein